ncbi:MAG: hypothetical protein HQM10_05045 [Candidatus Riflebacteria bacterium]|nr:hypothetical protein [Candidatus Riflebacteria bacterium]
MSKQCGMGINKDDAMAESIKKLFAENRFSRIIECGTFNGLGSTSRFCEQIKDNPIPFFSIEVNTFYYAMAHQNLRKAGLKNLVTLINGLSVPRNLLPKKEEIDLSIAYSDFMNAEDPKQPYLDEVDFNVLDDVLGELYQTDYEQENELLFLDSAGHMGWIEFQYAISLARKNKTIILDDTNHIKHFKSMQHIRQHPKIFTIIEENPDRHGFAIIKYHPEQTK